MINPSYMEVLEIQLPLPLNSLFLPSVNIRVKDALFGGLRTPTLGTATVGLAGRLPATWPTDGALPWDVASTVTVETWENQRKIPAVGWKAAYLPTPADVVVVRAAVPEAQQGGARLRTAVE